MEGGCGKLHASGLDLGARSEWMLSAMTDRFAPDKESLYEL
jgi:hypothetical protein